MIKIEARGAGRGNSLVPYGHILPPRRFWAISWGGLEMKLAGFLLLLSGWGIVVATLSLLSSLPMRAGFVLAGLAVELMGLGLVVRSNLVPKG